MADHILDNVLTGKIAFKEFMSWLKVNQNQSTDETYPIENSLFILYFLNYVRENCSWILNKTVKNCSNSKKSTQKNLQNNNNERDDYTITPDAGKKSPRKNVPKDCNAEKKSPRKNVPKDCDAEKKKKILNPKTSDTPTLACHVTNQNDLVSPSFDGGSIDSKVKRRITPTPIQSTNKALLQFGRSDFASPPPKGTNDCFKITPYVQADVDLQNEREMLKLTKNNLSLDTVPQLCKNTPRKTLNFSTKTENLQYVIPDPELVTLKNQLLIMSEIYNFLLTQAMVSNLIAELHFLFELITAKITSKDKPQDKNVFSSIHNCVYFAVSVLNKQYDLLLTLDNTTLTLISKITFLCDFSPDLVIFLQTSSLHITGDIKLLTSNYLSSFFEEVKGSISEEKVVNFKKQQQLFHELLQEWQIQSLNCVDSKFQDRFAYKVRCLLNLGSSHSNLYHLALLFQYQLVSSCLYFEASEGHDELLNHIQKSFPGKLEKLQERFVMPLSSGESNPHPKFHGIQYFFIEFIQHASSPSFNQYLLDVFISKILELNDIDISSYCESNCTCTVKQIYTFLVLVLRLLGKFLGYIYFLPYKENNILPVNISNRHLLFRKHRNLPINVPHLLKVAIKKGKTILTVPWIVEYLSMIDTVAKNLEVFQDCFKILFTIYKSNFSFKIQKNNHLFLRLVIGWLLDVLDFTEPCIEEHLSLELLECNDASGIDSEKLVDKQLIQSCCLHLVEFKVLIYNFVHGIKTKNQIVRKITPLSTTKPINSLISNQQIEAQLFDSFSNIPPSSLRKIVKIIKFMSKCMTPKVISKINIELKNTKLKCVEIVQQTRQELVGKVPNEFIERNQQSTEFITTSALILFRTFRSSDFIYSACYNDLETLLSLLLSEDIKCIGDKLLTECLKIILQLTYNDITNWCDANLSTHDFKSDVNLSLKQLTKVVESVPTNDVSVSKIINFFRRLAVKIHSKSIDCLPEETFEMCTAAICFVKHHHILDSTKKLLILITVDVCIGLLTFYPELCCDGLNDVFITLWSNCKKKYVSEEMFLCNQHVKILLSSQNFFVSWTEYTNMINALICMRVLKVKDLKKCLKTLMRSNWKGIDLCNPFNYLKSMLNSFEDSNVENRSVGHES